MRKFGLVIGFVVAIFAGCVGTPGGTDSADKVIQDMDGVIRAAAAEIVLLVADRGQTVLAVSFFTDGRDQPSVYSDELSDGLTTEIANLAGPELVIVSRRTVVQILEELSFQMSDLVDENSQSRIGRQLGADLILTGTVTGGPNEFMLNAQLVEVETAAVIGGARIPFQMAGAGTGTTIVLVEQDQLPTIQTPNLTLTIVENFDGGTIGISPSTYQGWWGDRLLSVDGRISPASGAGPDGSTALAYDYTASFDRSYDPIEFNSTDVMFNLFFALEGVAEDQTGITFDINPGNASLVTFHVKAQDEATYDWHNVVLTLRRNEWTRIALPFELFMPYDEIPAFDPQEPFLVQISVPYGDNASNRAFTHEQEFSGRTMVDNVGYYRRDTALAEETIATLDGTEIRAAIRADLYEASLYVDYTESDEGVAVVTPGVEALQIDVSREAEGVVGHGQRVEITLTVGPEFQAYVDKERTLILSGQIQVALPDGGSELVFSVRSDTIVEGDLSLYATGWYDVYSEFPVSGFWNDVVIPLDPERPSPAHALIDFRFPVPWRLMEKIMQTGELTVDVTFDEFRVR